MQWARARFVECEHIMLSGTQCLNTAPFCAGARVLVLGLQVWTQSYSEQAGQTGIFVNMYSVVSQICPVKSVKALVLCTAVLDLCKNLVKKTLRTSQPVLTNGKRPKFWLCPMKQNPKWNILMMGFKIWLNYTLCTSRKYQYSPHRRDWNFLGVGGGRSVGTKNLRKCVKLYWNFQRGGGGGLRKIPFCGGGVDIFWNYTL